MANLLLKNSFSNVGIVALKLAITFVMAPVIVRGLGNHDYGIYDVVLSVLGYMGMLNFGMQPAIVTFVARYHAAHQKEELEKVYSSAMTFALLLGVLLCSVLVLWAFFAPGVLTPAGAKSARYSIFLLIVAFQTLCTFPGLVCQCFHQGYQRYGLVNRFSAINSVIGSSLLYVFLNHGYGLLALSLVNAAGMTIKYFCYWLWIRHPNYGGFRFRPSLVSLDSIREMLKFGFKSFSLGLAGKISYNTDSIVIGSFMGPAVIPFFVIPAGLLVHLKNVTQAMTLGFLPFFSDLHAKNDQAAVNYTYLTTSRYVGGLVVCCLLGVGFLGPAFLGRWMGAEFAVRGKIVLWILLGAYALPLLNPFQSRLLTGMGSHGVLAKARLAEAAANLLLSVAFVHSLGIEGVALGTLIPALCVEPFVLWYSSRKIGATVGTYLRTVLLPLLAPAALTGALYVLLVREFPPEGYATIISLASSASIFFLSVFAFASITASERRQLFGKIKRRFAPSI